VKVAKKLRFSKKNSFKKTASFCGVPILQYFRAKLVTCALRLFVVICCGRKFERDSFVTGKSLAYKN
jgi:hypothetical protein